MSAELPLVEPLERALFLRSLEMFRGLGSEEIVLLAQLATERFFPAGARLLEEDEPPEAVHLLVSGRVLVERGGRAVAVREAPIGVGLFSVIAGRRAPRATAATDVVALTIDANAFSEVIEDHFSIFLHMRAILAEELRRIRREVGIHHSIQNPDPDPGEYPGRPLTFAERLLWLRRCPVFDGLGVNVLAGLARGDREERFAPGAALWEKGDIGRRFLLVAHGIVEGATEVPGGSFRAGPGAALGIDAAFDSAPYEYRATTETRVVAIPIDAAALFDLMEDHSDFAWGVLRFYAREITRLEALRAGVRA